MRHRRIIRSIESRSVKGMWRIVRRRFLTKLTNAALSATIFIPAGCSLFRDTGCDEILSVGEDVGLQSRIHHSHGIRSVEKGKLPQAEHAFKKAIAMDQSNASAHNNLGLVHYQQRRLAKAAEHFDIAAQLMPESPTPLNNLGMTLEAAGQGFEAIDYYHEAYERDPSNPLYLGNLVRARLRMGDNDESVIGQLQELLFIETRPDWVNWINDQLAIELNPYLDRGPEPADLNSKKSDSKDAANDKPNEVTPLPQVNESWEEVPGAWMDESFLEDGATILVDPSDRMVEVELQDLPELAPSEN